MAPWLDASIFGLTFFFMLIGLVGLIIPVFPGTFVMWLAALAFGVVNGFNTLGIIMFVIITLIFLGSTVADEVMMGLTAHKEGAAWTSLALGMIAGIIGTLLLPPIGGMIAGLVMLYLAEFIRTNSWGGALRSVRGVVLGWGLGVVARVFMGILIIVFWMIWAWYK
jgi:hypothetical protein